MKKITELQFLRIVDTNGKKLGHVFDVRSDGAPEQGGTQACRQITELVYGRSGLLTRLGLLEAKTETVPWNAVSKIKYGTIIVESKLLGKK